MPYGLIASLILHAVLLGWALLKIEQTPQLVVTPPEAVEIAMVADDGVVRLKQGERDSKNLEAEGKQGEANEQPKKEAAKPTPPPPPPPPPPPVEPAATPPAPTPDDQKMLDEKLAEDADLAAKQDIAKAEAEKAKAAAERQKKLAEDKRKQELEKKRLADLKAKADAKKKADAQKDFMKVAENALKNAQDAPPKAVLDKAPPKPGAAAGAKSATATPNIGPAAGAREGTDKVLTADKLSLLNVLMKNNVQRCWNINAGMEDAAKLVVKAEFKLSQDGRLIGEPLIKPAGAIASGPKYEDAANSAKRALVDCQPYSNLPPELYVNGWDYMSLVFDPSKMFH